MPRSRLGRRRLRRPVVYILVYVKPVGDVDGMVGAYSNDQNTAENTSSHNECPSRKENKEFELFAEGEARFE